eukprot:1004330_1
MALAIASSTLQTGPFRIKDYVMYFGTSQTDKEPGSKVMKLEKKAKTPPEPRVQICDDSDECTIYGESRGYFIRLEFVGHHTYTEIAGVHTTKTELVDAENKAWRDGKSIKWKFPGSINVHTFKRKVNPFEYYHDQAFGDHELWYHDGLQDIEVPFKFDSPYIVGIQQKGGVNINYKWCKSERKVLVPFDRLAEHHAKEKEKGTFIHDYTVYEWCLVGIGEEIGEHCLPVPVEKNGILSMSKMVEFLNLNYNAGGIDRFDGKQFSLKDTMDGVEASPTKEHSFPLIVRDFHDDALMFGGLASTLIVLVFCIGLAFGMLICFGYQQKKALEDRKKE